MSWLYSLVLLQVQFWEDKDDKDVETEDDIVGLHYYQTGPKHLVLIDSQLINICTNITLKFFQDNFPELKFYNWYHVIKWYDDAVD